VRGLFGGAARHLVVATSRVVPLGSDDDQDSVLLALAATACRAARAAGVLPDLIVGNGVLGRLLRRVVMALGGETPVVWESNPARRDAAAVDPAGDRRYDYRVICDVSGDAGLLDSLIARLAPQGSLVLAGFYGQPLAFSYPPAFQRELRLLVSAEWHPEDLQLAAELVRDGRLSLAGLVSHHARAHAASEAYRQAFEDPDCLKMVLDWRSFDG
jgi:3-hydroxyethyl bacteriochlorophyllide a dehydrogenase